MITLTALVIALALGWIARMLWRGFVRVTTSSVTAVPAEEIAH